MKNRRILVTGATGFTGGYVTRRMVEAGHVVAVLARYPVKANKLKESLPGIEICKGCFEETETLDAAMKGRDTLVNVASIGFGHADTIVSAAEKAGIKRAVFFSTTAIFTTLPANSKSMWLEAEAVIRKSPLNWTIIRPTMIYGTPEDRNIIRLINWIGRQKLIPVFGPGTFRLQPVFVDDLAVAVSQILNSDSTSRKEYNLSGSSPLTYNELVDAIAGMMNTRPILLHLPIQLSLAAVKLARCLPWLPRISPEQVLRLNEHKDFSHEDAARDFGFAPTPTSIVLKNEVTDYIERQNRR